MDAETLGRLLGPILERKGARRAILFGSHARGTADRRSDVDLIIVDDEQQRYLDRLTKYFDEVSEAVPGAVDLFVYTQAELDGLASQHFVRTALSEGKVVYERGKAGR